MPSDYRSALVAFMTEHAQPPEKLSHMPRLVTLTQQVGVGSTYDTDVVFATVWLHDLGVFTGHRPEDPAKLAVWDHTRYAMAQSPAILSRLGFPSDKIPAVVEAIRTHMPSGDPTTLEGTIMRDADILEQLGAVTVLRTAAKVGRDTRFPTFHDVIAALRKQLNTLPGLLQLPTAKLLAEPRVVHLRRFLEDLETEADGVL